MQGFFTILQPQLCKLLPVRLGFFKLLDSDWLLLIICKPLWHVDQCLLANTSHSGLCHRNSIHDSTAIPLLFLQKKTVFVFLGPPWIPDPSWLIITLWFLTIFAPCLWLTGMWRPQMEPSLSSNPEMCYFKITQRTLRQTRHQNISQESLGMSHANRWLCNSHGHHRLMSQIHSEILQMRNSK